jgi:hypothetical protein
MKLIRNAFVAGFSVATISLAACTAQQGSTGSAGSNNVGVTNGPAGSENVGSVGAQLTIGNGVTVTSLNWTLSNATNTYMGTVTVGAAQTVEFVAGGVVAGTYTLTLTGFDSNGDPCTGTSSGITVTAGLVSSASIVVTCTVPADTSTPTTVNTGSLGIDASVVLVYQPPYVCPGIESWSGSPASVLPPQVALLTSLSTAGSGGTPTILWSTTAAGASITNATSADATFNCGTFTGSAAVTLTVGLIGAGPGGVDAGQVCTSPTTSNYQTLSTTVVCETGGSVACFAPTPNACTTDAGSVCVSFATDINNCGSCGNKCASGDTCNSGTCTAPPPVPCTAAGQTNCIPCDQNTNGVCTQTEALIVTRDIEKGLYSTTGTTRKLTATSCYECMVTADCIDSTVQGYAGLECDDLTGTYLQSCLNTLNCITGSPQSGTPGAAGTANSAATATELAADCSNDQPPTGDGVFNCFCGSAETDTNDCKNASTVAAGVTTGGLGSASPNGACISQIIAGLPSSVTTATGNGTIIQDLSNTAYGSGQAFQILQCAGTNLTGSEACKVCYQ